MTAKPSRSKRRNWLYVVLGTIVLLTCFSASLTSMNMKTIVASSSTLQHSFGVDRRNARVKRYLRLNLNTTHNEDRGPTPELLSKFMTAKMATAETVVANVQKGFKYLKTMVAPRNQDVADQSFVKLGVQTEIDKNTKDPFSNVQFQEWAKGLKTLYKDDEAAAEVAKILTLLSKYKEDEVVKMIAAGKSVAGTKRAAENLEIGLLIKWTTDGGHVDEIFELLNFSQLGSKILESPLLKVWIYHGSKTGEKPYELLFAKLATRYSDEKKLAKLLMLATNNEGTRRIAKKLAKLQLKKWKNNHRSVSESFGLLKLYEESLTTLLTSPMLSTWATYAKMLENNPYDLLFQHMMEHMDDFGLATALVAAKRDGTNAHIVKKLEARQLEEWLSKQKSVGDVFRLLRLKEEGMKVLENSLWDTWVLYISKLEEKYGATTEDILSLRVPQMLKDVIGGKTLLKLVTTAKTVEKTKELATKMEHKVWQITGQTPDDVFDLLKLKKKGETMFETAEFRSWNNYVTQLSGLTEFSAAFVHISLLKRRYGSRLQKMLENADKRAFANHDEDTKKIVTTLLELLKSLKSQTEKKGLKARFKRSFASS